MKKQIPKPDFLKWQKWQKAIENIDKELRCIDRSRKIFLKVWGVINQNSKLKKHLDGIYLKWLIHNYCVKLGMGIRRLIDIRSNALNIYKLLKDVEKNIQQINVDNLAKYFVFSVPNKAEGYNTHCYGLALRVYKKALGRRRFLLSDLEKDIKAVDLIKEKIETYVDKNWAHMDDEKVYIPKVEEAHDYLDTLIKIYIRYSLLIGGHKFKRESLLDWDKPLRILWVK